MVCNDNTCSRFERHRRRYSSVKIDYPDRVVDATVLEMEQDISISDFEHFPHGSARAGDTFLAGKNFPISHGDGVSSELLNDSYAHVLLRTRVRMYI